jgi:predicted transcriptional regulator
MGKCGERFTRSHYPKGEIMMDIPTGNIKTEAWRLYFTPKQCQVLEQLNKDEYITMSQLRESVDKPYMTVRNMVEYLRIKGAVVIKSNDYGRVMIKRNF